ncbi:ATP-binding protein [Inmirania thermothiophila]|uniref:histidine kinase n=1 Tax=Inmirania thermothiophila TaxID=1750597 RepID=A0A3N1XZS5_9GAMM|nr:ATP-binding protein [Inmirania thermothiophila]ROR32103.1 two-component sensor kinase CbrA [Inmirania thermothiophila]
MTFELGPLYAAAVAYLGLLFLIAWAVERGLPVARLVRHPATYVLSLGVYATTWTYYGSVGFAQSQGYNFLTIYLGATLAFLLTPYLLAPILRLTREYQLTSVADLFAFRYRSQLAGVLTTVFMIAGVLPYIALQIRAVTESLRILTQEATSAEVGFGFCLTLTLFAILFGARHVHPRDKHEGLVAAIAFESVVKLVALMAVGLFAYLGVLGGGDGLWAWLAAHPQALARLYEPVRDGPWSALVLLSFAAAFLLPRQFHMAFAENIEPRALRAAAWGFPLYLLLLNLPILPVLWAGQRLGLDLDPDYYVLGITLASGSPLLPALAFVGGVSAASAMMIVTTLALAAMAMNHLLLPASYPDPRLDIYRWLLWGRRLLIGVIIFAGYVFSLLLEQHQGLVRLGLVSFVAVAQLLPGVVGVLLWPRATRAGFVAGLAGGAAAWLVLLVLPLLRSSGVLDAAAPSLWAGLVGDDPWSFATFWSLALNTALFVGVSLVTRPSPEEQDAANACARHILLPPGGRLTAGSPAQLREQLAAVVGAATARKEVGRALRELGMGEDERRPTELRRLRDRIERNLSGLVGPQLARMILDRPALVADPAHRALADGMRFIEERLEESRAQLQGLAAELDALRRYHRQILYELPLGVCALGPRDEVVIWNLAMELVSGIDRTTALATPVADLPAPWGGLLASFAATPEQHRHKQRLAIGSGERWFNLHKAALGGEPAGGTRRGLVILVEDLTEMQRLEAELAHSERLASVGRLAAGVAHEIGNPVTAIACLAQNLLEEDDPEAAREAAREILAQTRRISDIVQSLVSFAHGGSTVRGRRERVRLAACAEEALRLVRLSHAGRRVQCRLEADPAAELVADARQMVQVLVNLLTNACDASEPGGEVVVRIGRRGGDVLLEVADRGCGIPEDLHERIFEPFFTTKEPGQGTGLGLPLVYSIVRAHGGQIQLESRPGAGTRVRVTLPGEAPALASPVTEA